MSTYKYLQTQETQRLTAGVWWVFIMRVCLFTVVVFFCCCLGAVPLLLRAGSGVPWMPGGEIAAWEDQTWCVPHWRGTPGRPRATSFSSSFFTSSSSSFSSSCPALLDLSALTYWLSVYLKGYCRQMQERPPFLCGTEPITESSHGLFVSFWRVLCSLYFPLLPFSPLCMYPSLLLSPCLSFTSLSFPRGLRLWFCFCFCFSSLLSSVPDIFANTL